MGSGAASAGALALRWAHALKVSSLAAESAERSAAGSGAESGAETGEGSGRA